jgi:hypothetical protein
MHGGASTGPRTDEGRERCRQARMKHGRYSAETMIMIRHVRQQVEAFEDFLNTAKR